MKSILDAITARASEEETFRVAEAEGIYGDLKEIGKRIAALKAEMLAAAAALDFEKAASLRDRMLALEKEELKLRG